MSEQLYHLINFTVIAATMAGMFIYRWRGSEENLPRPIPQAFFCIVFLFAMNINGVSWVYGWPAFAIAVLACSMGHGQYFLSLLLKTAKPERIDFIISIFFGHDPREGKPQDLTVLLDAVNSYGKEKLYWRSVAGLTLTGLIVTLAPGLALMTVKPVAGLLLAISGALKGLAYDLSHRAGFETVGGEYLTGAFIWYAAANIAIIFAGI